MAKKTQINVNLADLKKLIENVDEKVYTKVGILAGDAAEPHGDATNVEIGLVHEFGSITNGVPARSFLRMPVETKGKEITKALITNKKNIEETIAKKGLKPILKKMGAKAEAIIQEAFESKGFGSWADNSPATQKRKKSDMPLIDTGQLRQSITSKVVKYE